MHCWRWRARFTRAFGWPGIVMLKYYNAWICQLLWFKFCCCICLYLNYIIYNTSCPLMWHVSSQHHQTSTTKLVMLLSKYFAWFAVYQRRTIWMEGWGHRKTTHDSIHYSSTKKSCMTPNKTLSIVSLSTIRALISTSAFVYLYLFFHTLEKDSLLDRASNSYEYKI